MELELNRKEVEKILLDWAKGNISSTFKSVELADKYSSRGATFTEIEPEKKDD